MTAGNEAGVGPRMPDVAEYIFCTLFTIIAIVAWTSLTLAELRAFSLSALCSASLLTLATVGVLVRRMHLPAPSAGTAALLWIVLLAVTSSVLLRPVDTELDGTDENVYRHLGSLIVHRGGLAVDDRLLVSTPPDEWRSLFSLERHWPHRLNRFEGGIQVAPGNPRLEPNFLHLLPAWIAAVEALGGAQAAPFASPLLAMLAPVALFLATRRLVGTGAAMAASLLLALNAAQVWAGRLPLSEVPVQFFVLSGLFFLTWWLSDRHALAGALAGVAFGLATLCRFDTLVLVVPIVAAVIALDWNRRGGRWPLPLVVLTVFVAQALVHAFTVSLPYTLRLGRHLARDTSLAALGTLAAAANVVLGLIVLWRRLSGHRLPASLVARGWQMVALVVIVWVLVRIGPAIGTHHLVLALTPFGAALACIGLLQFAGRNTLPVMLVTALLLASSLVYVESARDSPELPGVLRRDVAVLLPLFLLVTSVLLFPPGAGRTRRLVGAAATLWLVVAGSSHLLLLHREPSGDETRQALEALAGALPRDALVVVEPGLPSHLDLALDFTFDRVSLLSRARQATPLGTHLVITRAVNAGTPVFVVTRDQPDVRADDLLVVRGLRLTPHLTGSIPVGRLGRTQGRWPDAFDRIVYPLVVYQVRNMAPLPWEVDVGGQDYGSLGAGWLDRETLLGTSGRWTNGSEAEIAIPELACDGTLAPLEVRVRLASLRPRELAQPLIHLTIDGYDIGSIAPEDSDFHVYALALPTTITRQVCQGPATMMLTVPPFVPRRDAGLDDERQLGVAVDWIAVDTSHGEGTR